MSWCWNKLVKLVSRGIWTQDRLSRLQRWRDNFRQLCFEGPGTLFHLCYECPALRVEKDMRASQELRQAARSLEPKYRKQFARRFRVSLNNPASRVASAFLTSLVEQPTSRRAPGGGTSSPMDLPRAQGLSGALGCGGRRRLGEPQVSGLRGSAATCCSSKHRATGRTTQRRWLARSRWIRSRCTSITLVPSQSSEGRRARPWEPKGKGRMSGASQGQDHATEADVPLTFSEMSSPRKGLTHTSPFFALHEPLWLSPPWPSKLPLGGLGPCGAAVAWLGQHAAAPRERARPPRTRTKRTQTDALEMSATGSGLRLALANQSLAFLARQSTRTKLFQKHSLHLGRVFIQRGRTLDRPIVFSAGQCTGGGPTRCDGAAANIQVGALLSTAS